MSYYLKKTSDRFRRTMATSKAIIEINRPIIKSTIYKCFTCNPAVTLEHTLYVRFTALEGIQIADENTRIDSLWIL